MSERAAVYTVSVRPRRGQPLPLGDVDGTGTTLASVLADVLRELSETSADGSRVVRSLLVEPDGVDLFAIVQHGSRGLAADIVDAGGTVRLRQKPDDLQLVRCGCLFRLPPEGTEGLAAVHVSNGRGVKGLIEQGLAGAVAARFPGLRLALEPLADAAALQEAVAADRIERLRLTRLEPPGARAPDGTGKWVDAKASARVEVDVAIRTPGHHIERTLIQRYLSGDEGVLPQIVSFGGVAFDSALVGVVLADGTRRLFDLTRPAAGRPLVRPLPDLPVDADGEATPAGLLAALRASLELDQRAAVSPAAP